MKTIAKGLDRDGCCVSSSVKLLVYGGGDGHTFRGGLYKLSSLWKWDQFSEESDANDYGPMRKFGLHHGDERSCHWTVWVASWSTPT